MNSVAIAICTFNRWRSLQRTLDSLLKVTRNPDLLWETVVVDNRSTDCTRETVDRYVSRLPLRYVREDAQGLSNARNRAIGESSGDLLIFTDDDVLLDPDWADAFVRAAQAVPSAGYFGGKVVPHWADGTPRWFREDTREQIGGLIVTYDLGPTTRLFEDADPMPVGASIAFRRDVLLSLGPFRTDLGVNGTRLGGGEETDMIMRARSAGISGVYVADSVCRHVVENKRLALRYAFRYGYDRAKTQIALEGVSARGSYRKAAMALLSGACQMMKGRGDRVRLCFRNAGAEIGRCRHVG